MFGSIRGAFSKFFASDGLFLGAGLAFFALVCLIPLLLLAASILGFVLSHEQAAQTVVGQLTQNVPVYRRELSAALLRIVETRKISGVVGTVVLMFFSLPLLRTSRLVLHRMLGVKAAGSFLRNLLVDLGMVLVLGGLLFLATAATWAIHWVRDLILTPALVPPRWINGAALALSVVPSLLMFFLGYRYIPSRPVRVGPALAGAVLASALWEVAKQLFRLYITRFALYDRMYGPLGALVAFVMFVYYSAVVFVFGAAYVAALQKGRR